MKRLPTVSRLRALLDARQYDEIITLIGERTINPEKHPEVAALYLRALMQDQDKREQAHILLDRLGALADYPNAACALDIASAYIHIENLECAIAFYQKAVALSTTPEVAEQSRVLLIRAYLAANNIDAAWQETEEGLRALPNSTQLQFAQASILVRRGDYEQAITQFNKLLDADPTHKPARMGLQKARFKQGEQEDVLAEIKADFDAARDDQALLFHYIDLLQQADKPETALEALGDFTLDEEPDTFETIIAKRADLLQFLGRMEEARQELYGALALHKSERFFERLAKIEINRGQFDQAEQVILKGLMHYAKSPKLLFCRALLKKHQKDVVWFEADLRNTLVFQPHYADAHVNLAHILADQGKVQDAIEHYKQALNRSPSALIGLLYLLPFDQQAEYIEQLRHLLLHAGLGRAVRAEAAAHLVRYEDSCGHYDQAARHALEARNLWSASATRDPMEFVEQAEAILRYTQDNMPEREEHVQRAQNISRVFLVGADSAGGALIDPIMRALPTVASDGVTYMIQKCAERLPAAFKTEEEFPYCLDAWQPSMQTTIQNAWKYQSRHSLSAGDKFLLDSSPLNFAYIPFIKRIYPSALFINVTRSQDDAVLYDYTAHHEEHNKFYYYTSSPDAIRAMHDVRGRMVELCEDLFPESLYTMSYEGLCGDFPAEIAALQEWLQLPEDARITPGSLNDIPGIRKPMRAIGADAENHGIGRAQHYRTNMLATSPSSAVA